MGFCDRGDGGEEEGTVGGGTGKEKRPEEEEKAETWDDEVNANEGRRTAMLRIGTKG